MGIVGRGRAGRIRPFRQRMLTAALVAIVLAVTGVLIVRAGSHAHSAGSGATLTVHTIDSSHGLPDLFKIDAQYPILKGMANVSAQRKINTELSTPVLQDVSSFVAAQAREAHGLPRFIETSPAILSVSFNVYQTGNLVSVKYKAYEALSGAATDSYALESLTISLDTGGDLTNVLDFLTPTALSASGLTTLADDLQAQRGISECDSGFGGSSLVLQILEQMSSTGTGIVLNVTAGGLEFSFQDGIISSMACQPVGTLPLSGLAGLVSPTLVGLVGNPSPITSTTS
jgi:hypothetical protein